MTTIGHEKLAENSNEVLQPEPAEIGAFVLDGYRIPRKKAPAPQGLSDNEEDEPTRSQGDHHEVELVEADDPRDDLPSPSPPRKKPRQDMFCLVGENTNEWDLPGDLETFLGQYFAHWHSEDTIKEGILKDNPVPRSKYLRSL